MTDKKSTEEGYIGSSEYIRLTDEKVKELARDIVSNQVFGSWQLGNSGLAIEQVFMPLLFMDTIQVKLLTREGVAHLYEYWSQAGPMAVNGYPIFMSFYRLDQEDFDRVMAKVAAMERAIAEL